MYRSPNLTILLKVLFIIFVSYRVSTVSSFSLSKLFLFVFCLINSFFTIFSINNSGKTRCSSPNCSCRQSIGKPDTISSFSGLFP